jgi:hypothetical protein
VIKVAEVAKVVSFSVILRVRCSRSDAFADLLPGCPGLSKKVDSSPSALVRFTPKSEFIKGPATVLLC